MRSHRVPNWPDPGSGGTFDKSKLTPQSLGAAGPQLRAAEGACDHLLPNVGAPSAAQAQQAKAEALSFSRCVRAHGVPSFPDPQFGDNGQATLSIKRGAGIDPNDPAFQRAQRICMKGMQVAGG
jgi:hypothetical protein